jgi:SHS2 domain-containing protein
VILECWAPTFATCCAEAVEALVATCFDTGQARATDTLVFTVPPGPEDEMLLQVLDEILFILDTAADVPVAATAGTGDEGRLEVVLTMADRATTPATGSAPKAISLAGFEVASADGEVRCRFLVDV